MCDIEDEVVWLVGKRKIQSKGISPAVLFAALDLQRNTFHRPETKGIAIDNASNQSESGCNSIPTDCQSVYSETLDNDSGETFCKFVTTERRESAFEVSQSSGYQSGLIAYDQRSSCDASPILQSESNSLIISRTSTSDFVWDEDQNLRAEKSPVLVSYDINPSLQLESRSSLINRKFTPDSFFRLQKRGLNEADAKTIKEHFRYLKEELDAKILCDYFVADGLITFNEKEDILAVLARNKQVVRLLLKLLRMKPPAYKQFLGYLEDAGCKHVCDELRKQVSFPAMHTASITAEEASFRLKNWEKEIIEQLQPEATADIFLEHGEISVNEYEKIINQTTVYEQSKAIIQLLTNPDHLPRGYLVLQNVFKETGDGDFLQLLNENKNISAVENTSGPRQWQIKLMSVLKDDDDQHAVKALEESTKCEITIKLPQDTVIDEFHVVHELNELNLKLKINKQMIAKTETVVAEVKKGSIVIQLKGCRPDSFRKLFGKGIPSALLEILETIFLNPYVIGLFPLEMLEMEVTLNIPPEQPQIETVAKTARDRLIANMDFLLEEIDALSFTEELKRSGVLTDDEVSSILKTQPISRRNRMKSLLDMVLKKDIVAFFDDLLRAKNKHVWERVFQPETSTRFENRLTTEYSLFAESISPKAIANDSLVKEALTKVTGVQGRRRQAELILQHVLALDVDCQQQFLFTLNIYGQMPCETRRFQILHRALSGPGQVEDKRLKKKKKERLKNCVTVYKATYTMSRRQDSCSLPPIQTSYRRNLFNSSTLRRNLQGNNSSETTLTYRSFNTFNGPVMHWLQEHPDLRNKPSRNRQELVTLPLKRSSEKDPSKSNERRTIWGRNCNYVPLLQDSSKFKAMYQSQERDYRGCRKPSGKNLVSPRSHNTSHLLQRTTENPNRLS